MVKKAKKINGVSKMKKEEEIVKNGEQKNKKKGCWSAEEDKKLIDYVIKHGEKKWRCLPLQAGLNRCGKSCRLRWLNYLRPGIKRGNMTEEEDDLIIRLHNLLGNRWSLIAARLPGRTDNEIKNHWNTHLCKKSLTINDLNLRINQKLDSTSNTDISTSFQSGRAGIENPYAQDNLVSFDNMDGIMSDKGFDDRSVFDTFLPIKKSYYKRSVVAFTVWICRQNREKEDWGIKGEVQEGKWRAEEDKKLIDYITVNGDRGWGHVPCEAGLNRWSCRLRWKKCLDPSIRRGNLSADEKDLVFKLHNFFGNSWSLIASRLRGRTDNEVQNYWRSRLRKKKKMSVTIHGRIRIKCRMHFTEEMSSSVSNISSVTEDTCSQLSLERMKLPEVSNSNLLGLSGS